MPREKNPAERNNGKMLNPNRAGINSKMQSEIRAKCQIQTEQNKGYGTEVNNGRASILEC